MTAWFVFIDAPGVELNREFTMEARSSPIDYGLTPLTILSLCTRKSSDV